MRRSSAGSCGGVVSVQKPASSYKPAVWTCAYDRGGLNGPKICAAASDLYGLTEVISAVGRSTGR